MDSSGSRTVLATPQLEMANLRATHLRPGAGRPGRDHTPGQGLPCLQFHFQPHSGCLSLEQSDKKVHQCSPRAEPDRNQCSAMKQASRALCALGQALHAAWTMCTCTEQKGGARGQALGWGGEKDAGPPLGSTERLNSLHSHPCPGLGPLPQVLSFEDIIPCGLFKVSLTESPHLAGTSPPASVTLPSRHHPAVPPAHPLMSQFFFVPKPGGEAPLGRLHPGSSSASQAQRGRGAHCSAFPSWPPAQAGPPPSLISPALPASHTDLRRPGLERGLCAFGPFSGGLAWGLCRGARCWSGLPAATPGPGSCPSAAPAGGCSPWAAAGAPARGGPSPSRARGEVYTTHGPLRSQRGVPTTPSCPHPWPPCLLTMPGGRRPSSGDQATWGDPRRAPACWAGPGRLRAAMTPSVAAGGRGLSFLGRERQTEPVSRPSDAAPPLPPAPLPLPVFLSQTEKSARRPRKYPVGGSATAPFKVGSTGPPQDVRKQTREEARGRRPRAPVLAPAPARCPRGEPGRLPRSASTPAQHRRCLGSARAFLTAGPRPRERAPCLWLSLGWAASPWPRMTWLGGSAGTEDGAGEPPPLHGVFNGKPRGLHPSIIPSQGKLAAAQLQMPACPGPLAHDGNPQDGHGNWAGTVGCPAPGWQQPGGPSQGAASPRGENSGWLHDSIITLCHSATENRGLQLLRGLWAAPPTPWLPCMVSELARAGGSGFTWARVGTSRGRGGLSPQLVSGSRPSSRWGQPGVPGTGVRSLSGACPMAGPGDKHSGPHPSGLRVARGSRCWPLGNPWHELRAPSDHRNHSQRGLSSRSPRTRAPEEHPSLSSLQWASCHLFDDPGRAARWEGHGVCSQLALGSAWSPKESWFKSWLRPSQRCNLGQPETPPHPTSGYCEHLVSSLPREGTVGRLAFTSSQGKGKFAAKDPLIPDRCGEWRAVLKAPSKGPVLENQRHLETLLSGQLAASRRGIAPGQTTLPEIRGGAPSPLHPTQHPLYLGPGRRPRPASSPGALDHIWWPRQMTYLCLAGVPPTALGTSPGEAEMKQVPSVCLFRTLAISGRPRELTRGSTGELRLGRRALPAEAQAKHPPAVSWEHTRPADGFHCTGVVGLGTWQRALGDITWDDHGVPHTTLRVWTAEGRLKDSSTSLTRSESLCGLDKTEAHPHNPAGGPHLLCSPRGHPSRGLAPLLMGHPPPPPGPRASPSVGVRWGAFSQCPPRLSSPPPLRAEGKSHSEQKWQEHSNQKFLLTDGPGGPFLPSAAETDFSRKSRRPKYDGAASSNAPRAIKANSWIQAWDSPRTSFSLLAAHLGRSRPDPLLLALSLPGWPPRCALRQSAPAGRLLLGRGPSPGVRSLPHAPSQLSLELQAQPEFCPMWTQASPRLVRLRQPPRPPPWLGPAQCHSLSEEVGPRSSVPPPQGRRRLGAGGTCVQMLVAMGAPSTARPPMEAPTGGVQLRPKGSATDLCPVLHQGQKPDTTSLHNRSHPRGQGRQCPWPVQGWEGYQAWASWLGGAGAESKLNSVTSPCPACGGHTRGQQVVQFLIRKVIATLAPTWAVLVRHPLAGHRHRKGSQAPPSPPNSGLGHACFHDTPPQVVVSVPRCQGPGTPTDHTRSLLPHKNSGWLAGGLGAAEWGGTSFWKLPQLCSNQPHCLLLPAVPQDTGSGTELDPHTHSSRGPRLRDHRGVSSDNGWHRPRHGHGTDSHLPAPALRGAAVPTVDTPTLAWRPDESPQGIRPRGPRGGTGAESPEEAVQRLFQAQVTSGSDMKMTRAPGHLHPAAQKHLPSDTCCTQRHHTHTGTPHTETHTRHTDTQHTHAHTRTPPGRAVRLKLPTGSVRVSGQGGALSLYLPLCSTSHSPGEPIDFSGWLGPKGTGSQTEGARSGDLGRRLEEARRCCLGGADARRTEDGASEGCRDGWKHSWPRAWAPARQTPSKQPSAMMSQPSLSCSGHPGDTVHFCQGETHGHTNRERPAGRSPTPRPVSPGRWARPPSIRHQPPCAQSVPQGDPASTTQPRRKRCHLAQGHTTQSTDTPLAPPPPNWERPPVALGKEPVDLTSLPWEAQPSSGLRGSRAVGLLPPSSPPSWMGAFQQDGTAQGAHGEFTGRGPCRAAQRRGCPVGRARGHSGSLKSLPRSAGQSRDGWPALNQVHGRRKGYNPLSNLPAPPPCSQAPPQPPGAWGRPGGAQVEAPEPPSPWEDARQESWLKGQRETEHRDWGTCSSSSQEGGPPYVARETRASNRVGSSPRPAQSLGDQGQAPGPSPAQAPRLGGGAHLGHSSPLAPGTAQNPAPAGAGRGGSPGHPEPSPRVLLLPPEFTLLPRDPPTRGCGGSEPGGWRQIGAVRLSRLQSSPLGRWSAARFGHTKLPPVKPLAHVLGAGGAASLEFAGRSWGAGLGICTLPRGSQLVFQQEMLVSVQGRATSHRLSGQAGGPGVLGAGSWPHKDPVLPTNHGGNTGRWRPLPVMAGEPAPQREAEGQPGLLNTERYICPLEAECPWEVVGHHPRRAGHLETSDQSWALQVRQCSRARGSKGGPPPRSAGVVSVLGTPAQEASITKRWTASGRAPRLALSIMFRDAGRRPPGLRAEWGWSSSLRLSGPPPPPQAGRKQSQHPQGAVTVHPPSRFSLPCPPAPGTAPWVPGASARSLSQATTPACAAPWVPGLRTGSWPKPPSQGSWLFTGQPCSTSQPFSKCAGMTTSHRARVDTDAQRLPSERQLTGFCPKSSLQWVHWVQSHPAVTSHVVIIMGRSRGFCEASPLPVAKRVKQTRHGETGACLEQLKEAGAWSPAPLYLILQSSLCQKRLNPGGLWGRVPWPRGHEAPRCGLLILSVDDLLFVGGLCAGTHPSIHLISGAVLLGWQNKTQRGLGQQQRQWPGPRKSPKPAASVKVLQGQGKGAFLAPHSARRPRHLRKRVSTC
ncbi:hypothetical protein Cadr_000016419 [Camelus dromedarius]|uniref:Uncharacterized protein n=1 Tax=Camelus dromedarius TaxID=9838 RepID=A0A5N4E8Z1_CAMDR|nr:hypothetical protein Cadr_000016419 [Camelus dromedarius]